MTATQPKPDSEVITVDKSLVVLTPMQVLDRAVNQNASVEVLAKLMDLQERYEKNMARRAFDNAIATAKAQFKPVRKNRQVGFASKKPGASRTDYKHEDLAEIARMVDPILSAHGLSYRVRTHSAPNEPITVTCIISHRDGHSEENALTGPRDDSGNKNAIQQIGSAVTYLSRYTLKAALGLAASNDDDGKATGESVAEEETVPVITAEQQESLATLITSCGVGLKSFCKHYDIEKLEQLPVHLHGEAVSACNEYAAKVKAAKAAKAAKGEKK